MTDMKPMSTPIVAHFHLSAHLAPQSEAESEYMSRASDASVVGSLMYAMVCTRAYIAHVVSVVRRYMIQPRRRHWEVVK